MNEKWAKRLLVISAIWSFVGAVTALLNPDQHFSLLYTTALSLDQPLPLFFYRCTWISVLGWGGTYLFAALMPASRKAVLIPGGIGKVAFFFACLAVYSTRVGKTPILFAGAVDLVLAGVFGLVLLKAPQHN